MTRNTPADYKRCSDLGMTTQEAAKSLGVGVRSLHTMKRRYGITFKASPMGWNAENQNHIGKEARQTIIKTLVKPMTVTDIANRTGLSEPGIKRQLCRLHEMGLVRAEAIHRTTIWERATGAGA